MHDPAPKGMAHCPHSSIRAPPGPAHFPTVRRTVGTGRDADRPDVLFSSPMAHRVQLSRRLDKRKTPCFPARRLRGAADRIRTCGLSGRSRTIYPAELQPHILGPAVLREQQILYHGLRRIARRGGIFFADPVLRGRLPAMHIHGGAGAGVRQRQRAPIQSAWRASRRKTGMVASGAAAVTVRPPGWTAPVCSSVQSAPAGR